MQMKKIEADTLEEAYRKAAEALSCSVTEINYEIVQHPTSGVMGLFKKSAIIIAVKKNTIIGDSDSSEKVLKTKKMATKGITVGPKKELMEKDSIEQESQNNEIVKQETAKKREPNPSNKAEVSEKLDRVVQQKETIVDSFFAENKEPFVAKKEEVKKKEIKTIEEVEETLAFDDDRDNPENKKISLEIEGKISHLMSVACFGIDVVEVDVFDGIAHIFIDGEDAALLIGKEGYRYNALSYMLFNWINARYDLYIKLEIAEFIQAQEEMIDNYLKPISAHIIEHGKGKTKPLDGILVQIALEKLRAMFPNKYIAIKTGKDGKKFIIINNFNTRKSV